MPQPAPQSVPAPIEPGDPIGGGGGDGGSGGTDYPPIVTTSSLPNATIGAAYSETLTAAYGTGGYTWAVTAGALPAGLDLNAATGVISGTPTTAGTSSFVVTVTDDSSETGSANLSIVIPTQPSIVNSSLPAGTVGVPYTAALAGTGGAAPYTFAVTGGAIAPGLTLASTGGIIGTPTTQGTFNFTVTITDSGDPAGTGTAIYSITIQLAPLSATVRSLDQVTLLGCADGALYAIVPGQRHDEDYNGGKVGFFQQWYGVPTSGGKLGLNQLGGASVGAKGNGNLNVAAVDDAGRVTNFTTDARPMVLSQKETTRDFMAKAVPHSVRYAPRLDNGGVVDAWFEAHVLILWLRAFFTGRKA